MWSSYILQANKITGTGLPIVLGCTFTAVAPMILIGQTKGLDVFCIVPIRYLSCNHCSILFLFS